MAKIEGTTKTKLYRCGVGIVLVNKVGLVFVGQRINAREPAWQMPQGGINDGELPLRAALRELDEETGIKKAEVIAETSHWLHYDFPTSKKGSVWKGKYRGQKQKWYLMRFTGTNADINISTGHAEFSDWKWVKFHSLPTIIVEFKKNLYREIVRSFAAQVSRIERGNQQSSLSQSPKPQENIHKS